MMKYILLFAFTLSIYSCSQQESDVFMADEFEEQVISKNKLKLDIINQTMSEKESNIIIKALESGDSFSKIKDKIDYGNVSISKSTSESIAVVIFKLLGEDSFYSVKGKFYENKFVLEKEMLLGIDEENDRNLILMNDQRILVDYSTGLAVATDALDVSSLNFSFINDCQGRHGGTGFCQRESGENFSDCFNAERDEFCDGFFSCIGVNTSPLINTAIALACTCSASECNNN